LASLREDKKFLFLLTPELSRIDAKKEGIKIRYVNGYEFVRIRAYSWFLFLSEFYEC